MCLTINEQLYLLFIQQFCEDDNYLFSFIIIRNIQHQSWDFYPVGAASAGTWLCAVL